MAALRLLWRWVLLVDAQVGLATSNLLGHGEICHSDHQLMVAKVEKLMFDLLTCHRELHFESTDQGLSGANRHTNVL